ncbi:potassium channel [Phlyctema vagabunda]|uniref:Potassium channel n=1 Tax=Phlyctema vagabunda TaxID=108571 RepID=A0ABR4P503_9HELO
MGSDTKHARCHDDDLEHTESFRRIGRFKLRGKTDDLPQDWWFASTAIPLMAATIGPLANALSIAALVSNWRVELPNNGKLPEGSDTYGVGMKDPQWVIVLNAISLACGFFGNFCLLMNFTKRVRYIIALPLTIVTWYLATGILIGITIAMNRYGPPVRPGQTYSQGFWHAILAAAMYLIGSMMLMVNMLGYFLGHYPQHFDLDDDQRTLILQTMMFFVWLAGGAGVFARVCGFDYADALYYCNVTILTIGFGDIVATNTLARGLIFPYSVFGIIFLGLMINSIRKFAAGMSRDNVIRKHQLRKRDQTIDRSVTSEKELRDRLGLPPRNAAASVHRRNSKHSSRLNSLSNYGRFNMHGQSLTFRERRPPGEESGRAAAARTLIPGIRERRNAALNPEARYERRRQKIILLREERDRFNAMRQIQQDTSKFKQYYALAASIFAFGTLWCIGALVFYYAEHRMQGLTYFEALYFCYVSLLTIGYGDFSPRSNAGKPFFIVWSLVAIPTMTILISAMSDTIVSAINRGTFTLADWTVMPKVGVWADFLMGHPQLKTWLERKTTEHKEKKRVEQGFTLQDPDAVDEEANIEPGDHEQRPDSDHSLEKLAMEPLEATEHDLARKLAIAIKHVANDLRETHHKKYSYEEWVDFTRLIRFSRKTAEEVEEEEEEEGLVDWDWIGEDSPMLADVSESEWVLDRLCESLNRYTRRQAKKSTLNQATNDEDDLNAGDQNTTLSEDIPDGPNPASSLSPHTIFVAEKNRLESTNTYPT